MPRQTFSDTNGGGLDFGNLIKIATFLSDQDEKNKKYGTPAVPPTVTTDKPLLSGVRGYQTISGMDQAPAGLSPADADALMLKGSPGEGGRFKQPVYFKPGTPGTVGTSEMDERRQLLPYINSAGKSPDQIQQESNALLTTPGYTDAVGSVNLGPKDSKQFVVTKETADSLKKAGVAGYEENQILNEQQYRVLELTFKAIREGRLQKTVPQQIELGKLRITKETAKADQEKAKAAFMTTLTPSTTSQAPAPTKTTTKKDRDEATTYLTSVGLPQTEENIQYYLSNRGK